MTDILITGGTVYVGDRAGTVLSDGAVLVLDGTVAAVGDTDTVSVAARERAVPGADPVEQIDARGAMVLPGLVNAHWHDMAAMRLPFKGALRTPHDRDDKPAFLALGGDVVGISQGFDRFTDLMTGLRPDEAEAISRYSLATQLCSGVTTVGDTGSFTRPSLMVAAARSLGLRLSVSTWAADGALTGGAAGFHRSRDADAVLADVEELVAEVAAADDDLLHVRPGSVYGLTMSDELGRGLADLVERHRLPFAIHVGALRHEVPATAAAFGDTPVRRLARLGLLGEHTMAVHCAHLDETEQRLLLDARAHLSISPAKYGSAGETTLTETGAVLALRRAGLRVSLSTDGSPLPVGGMVENMAAAWESFGELAGDPTEVLPTDALAMATRVPAEALGWDGLGSLEVGCPGDVVLVRADDWRYLLNPRPLEGLLHLGGSADIDTVIVAGVTRVHRGRLVEHPAEQVESDFLDALESFTRRCLDVAPDAVTDVLGRARSLTSRREPTSQRRGRL